MKPPNGNKADAFRLTRLYIAISLTTQAKLIDDVDCQLTVDIVLLWLEEPAILVCISCLVEES